MAVRSWTLTRSCRQSPPWSGQAVLLKGAGVTVTEPLSMVKAYVFGTTESSVPIPTVAVWLPTALAAAGHSPAPALRIC